MKAAQELILHWGLKINHLNKKEKKEEKKKSLSVWILLRENLKLQQDVKADFSLQSGSTKIRSNVYNKPNHIAQPEPVFLKPGVYDILPYSGNKSAQLKARCGVFFIHPPEAETIFTTAPQQEQTRDIIKEITISLNSLERDT